NASGTVDISGSSSSGFTSGVFASASAIPGAAEASTLTGQAGDISITTDQLILSNQGELQAASITGGDGGNIDVQANAIDVNSSSRITAQSTGAGRGGNINAQANVVNLSDNAQITASTEGAGQAGIVSVSANENLTLTSGSEIATSTQSAGGGSIFINTPSLVQLTDSSITTTVRALDGDSGNITMNQEFIIMERSTIEANAFEGMGGNIDITVTGIFNFSGEPINRVITASSQFGVDGVVEINSPASDAIEGLITLPTAFNASALTQAECAIGKNAANLSRYVQVDYAGAGSAPGDWQIGLLPAAGFQAVAEYSDEDPIQLASLSTSAYPAMMNNCSRAAM
ncbi:MAG: hypothetical protein AAF512_14515, partial [Pseudomonadota bacterium]